MQINLEAAEEHAVQAYDHHQIQINSILYQHSLIVSKDKIITDLSIKTLDEINEDFADLCLELKPELIIIGHQDLGQFPQAKIMAYLSQKQIGIECMSLGAACRTYNLLLSEFRSVVAGFIFK
jgi:uncharacterized protein